VPWPFGSRRERLRREAAEWFAVMRGPRATVERPAFEAWYRASPENMRAYDRIAAAFDAAGALKRSDLGRARSLADGPVAPRRASPWGLAAAFLLSGVVILSLLASGSTLIHRRPKLQTALFAAPAGIARSLSLSDGSQLRLSPDALVSVSLGSAERRLRLVRGEARFQVSHEARPFIVTAGAAVIVAHGTQFIVRLTGRNASVSLIEGAIDVTYPETSGDGRRHRTRLRPGERLVMTDIALARPAPVSVRPGATELAMLDFDETPLTEAVARANLSGGPPIQLGDAALGALRVTGAFRSGDTPSFARSLAAAFGLELRQAEDGLLLVQPRRDRVRASH
jgi:transmembrane sensor